VGCLGVVLAIFAFWGNIVMFTGMLIGGLPEELEGNSAAALMVLVALIVDGYILWLICKVIKAHQESKERVRKAEEAAKEKATQNKIDVFCAQYRKEWETKSFERLNVYAFEDAAINIEMIRCVNQLLKDMNRIDNYVINFNNQIEEILCRNNFSSAEKRWRYLQENEKTLNLLMEKNRKLVSKRDNLKIDISTERSEAINKLREAFVELQNSKKKKIEDLHSFDVQRYGALAQNLPKDLIYFNSECEPICLRGDDYQFYIYPNVILVFDQEGYFVTALASTELKFDVKRMTERVFISNNKFHSEKVDADSRCIEEGKKSVTWLHTKVNGRPDLRYSYNPMIESHTDVMEYGRVEISVVGLHMTIDFSSQAAINAFENAQKANNTAGAQRDFPMLALMNLLENTTDNKAVGVLKKAYANEQQTSRRFMYARR
jgi:hypothetical protein